MNGSDQQAAEWQCQQLLNKMIHLLDGGRWEELSMCFSEDASFYRPADPDNAVVGRANILDAFAKRPPRITQHMLANSWFENFTGATMRAHSRVLVMSGAPSEKLPAPAEGKLMIGEFTDDLRKVDGRWLVAVRKGKIDLAFGG